MEQGVSSPQSKDTADGAVSWPPQMRSVSEMSIQPHCARDRNLGS